MFLKQKKSNNNSQNDFIVGSNGKVDINVGKLDIDNIPVYTMKNDLANLKKNETKDDSLVVADERLAVADSVKIPSERQKTSPFLAQEDRDISVEEPSVSLSDKELGFSEKPSGINWGGFLVTAIVILVVAILGLGGYYFWVTRMGGEFPSNLYSRFLDGESSSDVALPVVEEPIVPQESLSLTNPNLAVFEPATLDGASFKEFFLDKSQIISNESITSPVEFLLVDAQNNPIAFQDFAQKIGLGFDPSLLANLGPNFSLFLYDDAGSYRLGLVVDSKDETVLKKLLVSEENILVKDVEPLFLVSQYEIANKPFGSSSYNNIPVRYVNVISPESLSVDYAVYSSKLFIGTTKMTLRIILDKASNNFPSR